MAAALAWIGLFRWEVNGVARGQVQVEPWNLIVAGFEFSEPHEAQIDAAFLPVSGICSRVFPCPCSLSIVVEILGWRQHGHVLAFCRWKMFGVPGNQAFGIACQGGF